MFSATTSFPGLPATATAGRIRKKMTPTFEVGVAVVAALLLAQHTCAQPQSESEATPITQVPEKDTAAMFVQGTDLMINSPPGGDVRLNGQPYKYACTCSQANVDNVTNTDDDARFAALEERLAIAKGKWHIGSTACIAHVLLLTMVMCLMVCAAL